MDKVMWMTERVQSGLQNLFLEICSTDVTCRPFEFYKIKQKLGIIDMRDRKISQDIQIKIVYLLVYDV